MSAAEITKILTEHLDTAGGFSGVIELPLADLKVSESPRRQRTNADYVRMLAESVESFPPISVHRETMSVIDGHQRLEAHRARGEGTIRAVLFEGDAKTAFVLAVRLNVAHGLPLTTAERKAAALRLLNDHPDWSDRSIAGISGISDKTVAMIRRSGTDSQLSAPVRIGRNGIAQRALNEQGRRHAAELLTADPNATLREVAGAATTPSPPGVCPNSSPPTTRHRGAGWVAPSIPTP